jgi:hypothetical protein
MSRTLRTVVKYSLFVCLKLGLMMADHFHPKHVDLFLLNTMLC